MVQKLLALSGVGLTVVPEFAIHEYLKNKELVLIGRLGDACEDLYLISASRRIENKIASDLMKNFKVK
jgi:DNA-binding transcriptional LysR family regulator